MKIYLKDYQNLFIDGDATLAVQKALLDCKVQGADTLCLGGETLNFYAKYAFNKEYYISNNDYSRKSIIFPIIDMENFTVDGEGADLLFYGSIMPFAIDNSKNITLKNFTVDYPYPYFFQAEITKATDSLIEMTYDKKEFNAHIEGRQMVFTLPNGERFESDRMLNCEIDINTKAPSHYIPPYFACFRLKEDTDFLAGMNRYLTPTQVNENTIRFEGKFGHTHNVGNYWLCTFGDRTNPAVFGNKTKNITVKNVTLYASCSMGLICQLCENILMEDFNTVPREGSHRLLSVNADSTHFVNCTGFVRYEHCKFTNMLDDAGNCHGNYIPFERKLDGKTLLCTFGHFQQQGVNIFDENDKVYIINNITMLPVAEMTVKASTLISKNYLIVEFFEDLPEMEKGFTIENFTKMPELYINNCECGANRTRGFLPSTWRKTVITNNTFYNMSCALHFTGDCNDWFETSRNEDVQISGNSFKNSAYAGGPVIAITPNARQKETMYHKNFVIENNTFELHEERFIQGTNVENLVFRSNRFIKNSSLPSHEQVNAQGIWFDEHCKGLVIEQPVEVK